MSQTEPISILFLTFPKVAQAMWWVAQAMWWEGCAGYVVVPRSKIIPLRGPTCKIARFQAKLKFPSWTRVWQ